ncbi:MAG: hypothetical protein Q8K23_17595 [Sulfuritalea sp.]|nr:hypothetical protein [Sulfuritalea sp.]
MIDPNIAVSPAPTFSGLTNSIRAWPLFHFFFIFKNVPRKCQSRAWRVTLWGALAMAITAGVGALFDVAA